MKTKIITTILILFTALAFPANVQAVCPVCTVSVGVGLGISRWLGIDDTISGIWIGALILSSGFWLAEWIEKKGLRIKYKKTVCSLFFYLLVIPPLYLTKLIGISFNTFLGIDKVLFGTMAGSLFFLLAFLADKWLRKINDDKVFIYYQKVILPVLFLSLGSFIFYFATG